MIVNTAYRIQANLLAGNSEYTPNYIFVEYKNQQSSGTVSPVDVNVNDTKEHYNNLSADCDYLAIPITIKPRYINTSGSNTHSVEFSVVTSGFGAASGAAHGLDFLPNSHSTIYSLGLITRIKPDGTDDILFARTNLSSSQQLEKTTSDMYINWNIDLYAVQ